MRRLALVLALAALPGCHLALDLDELQWPDAGLADGGRRDAGPDAATRPDAGEEPEPGPDAGPADTGQPISLDAGLDRDAGPPLAAEDSLRTVQDVPRIVLPLANDTARTGGALSLAAFDTTSYANGTISAEGAALTYTPPAGYIGADHFQYTAQDPLGRTAQAYVRIGVEPPPPAPALALRSSAGVTTVADGRVSAWADVGGAQLVAAQVEEPRRPAFFPSGGPNDAPYLKFDGADDCLTLGDSYLWSPAANLGMEFFLVVQSLEARSMASGAPSVLNFGYGAEKAIGLLYDRESVGIHAPQTNGASPASGAVANHAHGTAWVVLSAEVHYLDELGVWLNGARAAQGSAATSSQLTAAEIDACPERGYDCGPITLGMQSKTLNEEIRNLHGSIAEVRIYDRWLSQGQREWVECTLSKAYAIPLAYPCW